jgi:hypothetical protein
MQLIRVFVHGRIKEMYVHFTPSRERVKASGPKVPDYKSTFRRSDCSWGGIVQKVWS